MSINTRDIIIQEIVNISNILITNNIKIELSSIDNMSIKDLYKFYNYLLIIAINYNINIKKNEDNDIIYPKKQILKNQNLSQNNNIIELEKLKKEYEDKINIVKVEKKELEDKQLEINKKLKKECEDKINIVNVEKKQLKIETELKQLKIETELNKENKKQQQLLEENKKQQQLLEEKLKDLINEKNILNKNILELNNNILNLTKENSKLNEQLKESEYKIQQDNINNEKIRKLEYKNDMLEKKNIEINIISQNINADIINKKKEIINGNINFLLQDKLSKIKILLNKKNLNKFKKKIYIYIKNKIDREYNQKYTIINIDNNISSIKIILENIKNNLKIEINNLKIDINKLKIEINNLKIDINKLKENNNDLNTINLYKHIFKLERKNINIFYKILYNNQKIQINNIIIDNIKKKNDIFKDISIFIEKIHKLI